MENSKVTYDKNEFGYYIQSWEDDIDLTGNFILSYKIDMYSDDYAELMINNFNGQLAKNQSIIYFKTEEDVNNAVEWMRSMIIMNNLAGDKNVK